MAKPPFPLFWALILLMLITTAMLSIVSVWLWLNGYAIWALLSGLVIISLSVSSFLFYRYILPKLTQLTSLENWAYLAKITQEFHEINDDNVTHQMINRLIRRSREIDNISNTVDQKIRSQILLDSDTGIGNREYFDQRLDALLKEEDIQGAVYFINFNEGEVIDSLYGHAAVKQVFNQLITSINSLLTKLTGCYLARRSAYELALIAPGVYITEAEKLASRLIKTLSNVVLPIGVDKESFVHIGVSYFSQAENSYQIKSEADMALRSAQLQGPSQWFMFEPGEVEHVSAKGSLQWRSFLERAIAKNAFVLFFQPVMSAKTDSSLHHEMLVKVRNEDGQLISARVFLPMAAKSGLIKDIDLLMFSQVCRLLSYDKYLKEDCSLNLSTECLLAKGFVAKIIEILREYYEISTQLIVEISEYQLVNHLTELAPVLSELQQLGIRILVDKVGQYVESVEYLKSCPIFAIKLHASVVINIHQRSENQIFVQSLVNVCQLERVDIYAFGVESAEEWRTLKKLGIDGGQGHYFTEPMAQVAKAIHFP